MADTTLTVVIPARGQVQQLPTALAHLEVQTFPSARFEVVIAQHGPARQYGDDDFAVIDRYIPGAPIPVRMLRGYRSRAHACNAALRDARGSVVLFLDEDLLAAPNLVETHVDLHEHLGDARAVIGTIGVHPHTDPRSFTRPQETDPNVRYRLDSRLGFLDWRLAHISFARHTLLDAGGFDESPELAGLEDLELAWRLTHEGVKPYFASGAMAMAWRPATIEDERHRHYLEGYALRALESKSSETGLLHHFHRKTIPQPYFFRKLYTPLFSALSSVFASNTGVFRFLVASVAYHDMLHGYRDARSGLSPTPPALTAVGSV